ncbi:MAG TPA: DUF5804 family protein [Methanocorpusculum sp.]|nr:DUF5804 family protein [Methanocorpusculum sp.]
MDVVCIAKPGVNLSDTLFTSETSRNILRFYHPKDMRWGVRIPVSTVSNALALLSELRWYMMRYASEVIIEDVEYGVYLTRLLASAAYEDRSVALSPAWEFWYRAAVLEDGSLMRCPRGTDTPAGTQVSFLVWCREEEEP